tara:strand:- start:50 stop:316 length:267 start_codon:yes stop_codon:yes gene_type:complete
MSDYSEPEPVSEAPTPAPQAKQTQAKQTKKKREGVKMTDKQKADLNKHMEKHKKAGMSASEMKSHRMKMMSRMRKGMSVNKAHKDIMN